MPQAQSPAVPAPAPGTPEPPASGQSGEFEGGWGARPGATSIGLPPPQGGAVGTAEVGNADFTAAIFRTVPEGAVAVVCSKRGDPGIGGWMAIPASNVAEHCPTENNNYLNGSSFRPDAEGNLKARKENFAACHHLMLDDIGTKVPFDRVAGFTFSWVIETSPGNHQAGIILDPPLTDAGEATRLLEAIIAAGLCDPGSSGPVSRWARLPVGINGKPKYADAGGKAFHSKLISWNPDKRYTPAEVVAGLKLPPAQNHTEQGKANVPSGNQSVLHDSLGASSTALVALPKGGEISAPSYGPPDLTKLASALKFLTPDCDEKTWKLYRLAPMAVAAREHPEMEPDLRKLAMDWSSGALRARHSLVEAGQQQPHDWRAGVRRPMDALPERG